MDVLIVDPLSVNPRLDELIHAEPGMPVQQAVAQAIILEILSLVKQGAETNTKNREGQTLLHIAALAGNLEACALLIVFGAGLTAKDRNGDTPLAVAAENDSTEICRLFIQRGADPTVIIRGSTLLHVAAQKGSPELYSLLLENGLDVNAPDEYGCTPLHSVAALNRSGGELCRFLIEQGANTEAVNKRGATPLHQVSINGCLEPCIVLIDCGANMNAQNDRGMTPLHSALSSNFPMVAEVLINNGANVNVRANGGFTALHLAITFTMARKNGSIALYKKLIRKGADISARNSVGETPLHLLIEHYDAGTCKEILSCLLLPSLEEGEAEHIRMRVSTDLNILREQDVSRNRRYQILCNDPSLGRDFVSLLYYDHCNGQTLDADALNILKVWQHTTVEMLKSLLGEIARRRRLDEVLNPRAFEGNFGELLFSCNESLLAPHSLLTNFLNSEWVTSF